MSVITHSDGRHAYRGDVSPKPHGNGERGPEERPTPQGSDGSRGLSLRSGVWLTTLSTVVAVATGMFTLRDQIFPENAGNAQGNAQASRDVYEQSVGRVCDAANEAERARARNARRLSNRLKRARTTLAQRNALLDSTNQVLASSEHRLAGFRGLDVPGALVTRERETAAAWGRMVTLLRGYAQRLDAVTNRRELAAVVKTLPAMRTALARSGVTRDAGLTQLGGGHCELDAPIFTPTITLDQLGPSVTAPSPGAPPADPPRPSGSAPVDPARPSVVPPSTDEAPPPPPPPPVAPSADPLRGGGDEGG